MSYSEVFFVVVESRTSEETTWKEGAIFLRAAIHPRNRRVTLRSDRISAVGNVMMDL